MNVIKVLTLVKSIKDEYQTDMGKWLEEKDKHMDLMGSALDEPDPEEYTTWTKALIDVTNIVNGTCNLMENHKGEVLVYYGLEHFDIVAGTLDEWMEIINKHKNVTIYNGPKTIRKSSR